MYHRIKSRQSTLIFLLVLTGLTSCVSKRNTHFFRDLEDKVALDGVKSPEEDYKIKSNDNLYVSVKTINPEVNAMFSSGEGGAGVQTNQYTSQVGQHIYGYQVDSHGEITLPIIGSVYVAERTLKEAKEEIGRRAEEYLKDADIQVRLLNFKVSVLGEVNSPGVYYNYNNTLTILEAIGMAKGASDFAKIKDVIVLRQKGDKIIPYEISLTDSEVLTSDAYYLQSNDVVLVRPQQLKNVKLNASYYTIFTGALTTIILFVNYFWG